MKIKKIKKIVISIITLIATIVLSAGMYKTDVKAASGSISVSVSSANVIAGNSVTVTVKLSLPVGIASSQVNLSYDSNLFTCNEGSYAGVIDLYCVDATSESSEYTWTYTFKANSVGNASFSAVNVGTLGLDSNPYSPSSGSASVQVWAPGSDDASLKTLSVAGYSLSPAFSAGTTDYTCYVGNDITAVNVTAATTQGGRTELSGNPNALNVGSNYVSVTSYAPNGATRKYTINIYRLEPATEPETTTPEETTATPDDVDVDVDGNTYTVSSEFANESVPAGFSVDIVNFKGKDVLGAVSNNFTLLYLVDGKGSGAFYIYDSAKVSFYKYTSITVDGRTYVFMDPDSAGSSVDGCTEGKQTIADVECDVYISDSNKEFVYFYAMNEAKESNWYCYDTVEKTVQRLNIVSGSSSLSESDIKTFQDEITALKTDKNDALRAKNARNVVIIACGIIIVILAGVLIATVVRKSGAGSKKKDFFNIANNDEDDDFDDEDDNADSDVETENEQAEDAEATEDEAAATVEENVAQEESEITAEESPVEESPVEEPTVEEPEAEEPSIEVTEEEVDDFAKEAETFEAELAKDIAITSETMDIEPEIISLDDEVSDEPEPETKQANEAEPIQTEADEDVETINAADIKDDDFFL